jgi:hypothetical protein
MREPTTWEEFETWATQFYGPDWRDIFEQTKPANADRPLLDLETCISDEEQAQFVADIAKAQAEFEADAYDPGDLPPPY